MARRRAPRRLSSCASAVCSSATLAVRQLAKAWSACRRLPMPRTTKSCSSRRWSRTSFTADAQSRLPGVPAGSLSRPEPRSKCRASSVNLVVVSSAGDLSVSNAYSPNTVSTCPKVSSARSRRSASTSRGAGAETTLEFVGGEFRSLREPRPDAMFCSRNGRLRRHLERICHAARGSRRWDPTRAHEVSNFGLPDPVLG